MATRPGERAKPARLNGVKIHPGLVVCDHCDSVHERQSLEPHQVARCLRCDAPLYRSAGLSMALAVALTLAAAVLFIVANLLPLVVIDNAGQRSEPTLAGAVIALAQSPAALLAVPAGVCFIAVPAVQIAILLWLFAFARRRERAPGFAWCLRALHVLRPWSMTEVCLLGGLIALIKLGGLLGATPGMGLWALGALSVCLLLLANRDINALWSATADRDIEPPPTDLDPWLPIEVRA